MGKALLTFPVKTATSDTSTFEVSIIRYTSGYQSQISTAAVRRQRHGYPIRIKESDLSITIQCRSVAEYDEIKKTIAISQRLMLDAVNRGFVRFSYPDLDLDYLGFIPQVTEGTRRFVSAPELSFAFSLFRDTINTVTEQYSTANGTWKDIAGEDLVEGLSSSDFILKRFGVDQFGGKYTRDGGYIPSGGTRPVF